MAIQTASPLTTGVIRVHSSSRLHLGFLSLEGAARSFGSVGLAVDAYPTIVEARSHSQLRVTGHEARRGKEYLHLMQEAFGGGGAAIDIRSVAPAHAGLGSGTQLALALGCAYAQLHDLQVSVRDIAKALKRGARSGIGIACFEQGGFIVDGGQTGDDVPPRVTVRLPVPSSWRVLLIMDPFCKGLHGAQEKKAFHEIPSIAEPQVDRLCRLVMLGMLPALAEGNLAKFGEAANELQEFMGEIFSPMQGGRYTSLRVGEAMDILKSQGALCMGQSSWGPMSFAIFANEIQAREMMKSLPIELDLQLALPCNHGASAFPVEDQF